MLCGTGNRRLLGFLNEVAAHQCPENWLIGVAKINDLEAVKYEYGHCNKMRSAFGKEML